MNDEEQAKLHVGMWKQTIEVQQHFNDICWRIRGLALTALTFSLGAAAVAAREPLELRLIGLDLRLSAVIAVVGFVLWLAFYFVDHVWYHRLLVGAVVHGEALEVALQNQLPEAGLTRAITVHSAYPVAVRGHQFTVLHSKGKLRLFYGTVAVLLLVFAVALQFGGPTASPTKAGTKPTPASSLTPNDHQAP